MYDTSSFSYNLPIATNGSKIIVTGIMPQSSNMYWYVGRWKATRDVVSFVVYKDDIKQTSDIPDPTTGSFHLELMVLSPDNTLE